MVRSDIRCRILSCKENVQNVSLLCRETEGCLLWHAALLRCCNGRLGWLGGFISRVVSGLMRLRGLRRHCVSGARLPGGCLC